MDCGGRIAAGVVVIMMMACPVSAQMQLDVAGLAEAFKAYDRQRNDGRGYCDSRDSGDLGWREGSVIESYALMWEATEDLHWLRKIRDHFAQIMAAASDPDGDGYLSWQTKTYSCAAAYAERLHNVSDASITPGYQKNSDGRQAAKCVGGTWIIEFPRTADAYRVIDATSRKPLLPETPYKSGADILAIEPFKFQIRGTPHQGDRFLVRTYGPQALEFAVHQGMFVFPVAQFIAAVKSRPQLAGEFGPDADRFLQFINKHVFEKNEQDWLDMGPQEGAYRFEPKLTDRYPNRIMPHNQYGALARAWLILKDVEGAAPLMARRAEQMVRYFHRHLEYDAQNDAYRWHYWDWIEDGRPGHSGYEDTSHGRIDVSLAVTAARCGVVFTDADMKRMANTWLKLMWNGDPARPRMASATDGRPPHEASPLSVGWSELAQWNRQVYELAMTEFEARTEKEKGRLAPVALVTAKRAGVRLAGLAAEQTPADRPASRPSSR